MKGLIQLGILVVLGLVLGVATAEDGNTTERHVQTFEEVEKSFKSAVGNLVKKILPYLMEGGGNSDVSGPCKSSIMKIIAGVRQLREWAMRCKYHIKFFLTVSSFLKIEKKVYQILSDVFRLVT